MARHIQEKDLIEIEKVVHNHPEDITAQQISDALSSPPPHRTLQYRIKFLVDANRLIMKGSGRWAKYNVPKKIRPKTPSTAGIPTNETQLGRLPFLSDSGAEIQRYVRQPFESREPVGYNQNFLYGYRPNQTFYLSETDRAHLHEVGRPRMEVQPAGTYVKKILNRLLIDLAWNSSRLEGNTYSLLDTTRLLELGEESEGKERGEALMILNHKEAIEFLVDSVNDIGFNRHTIRNLHAILADNLLANSEAAGQLRYIGVSIGGSVFHPLEVPQLIEECFDRILTTASAIVDPFEQSFFIMVQLPYLQPFDDVNKRVSRLAANIPLIKENLSPLSFEDVSRNLYTESVLGVYELNQIELLRDVFIWAYKRSASRYVAVQQSLGNPDAFRMQYRMSLREVVSEIVRGSMDKRVAALHIEAWARKNIDQQDYERFRQVAERELLDLHEGNFSRYRIRLSELKAWLQVWNR